MHMSMLSGALTCGEESDSRFVGLCNSLTDKTDLRHKLFEIGRFQVQEIRKVGRRKDKKVARMKRILIHHDHDPRSGNYQCLIQSAAFGSAT